VKLQKMFFIDVSKHILKIMQISLKQDIFVHL